MIQVILSAPIVVQVILVVKWF